jgi:hypothetical protein
VTDLVQQRRRLLDLTTGEVLEYDLSRREDVAAWFLALRDAAGYMRRAQEEARELLRTMLHERGVSEAQVGEYLVREASGRAEYDYDQVRADLAAAEFPPDVLDALFRWTIRDRAASSELHKLERRRPEVADALAHARTIKPGSIEVKQRPPVYREIEL